MAVPTSLRRWVVERADYRCEYCGLSQTGQEAAFHVDHIVPRASGGKTDEGNLALACVSCSLRKGARLQAPDPETGEAVALFHPRRDSWPVHFRWQELQVLGLTPTGRATVAALQMNRPLAWAIRKEETYHGRHPPPAHQGEPG